MHNAVPVSGRINKFQPSVNKCWARVGIFLLSVFITPALLANEKGMSAQPNAIPPILQSVIDAAKASAEQDYQPNDHGLNDKLKSINYQTYRSIRFQPEASLWRDKNDYEIQFFHPGFLYQLPVTVHTIDAANTIHHVPFDSAMFDYDGSAASLSNLTNENTGFAGFRVHYPIKTEHYKDEFAVFLGASYFRLVGKNQVYGISARGLAIDTALAKGEEFPYFTEFWLIEPKKGQPITIYARLESPSVAGAYKFVITPGVDTRVQVQSWLFAREDVEKLGIAPFTSMFLYGENSEVRPDDYRPEVHDSDGVLMVTHAGEEIWRPLTNPARLQITSLSDSAPQGFGMLQRDGQWDHYLDAEANYHKRPGLWVRPIAGFNNGRLEVVEIPTTSETNDNIVAYWVSNTPFLQGQSRYVAYQLKTVEPQPFKRQLARVVSTRQGTPFLPGEKRENNIKSAVRRFVVDFSIPEGASFDNENLSLVIEGREGEISQQRVYPINDSTQWRATFLVEPNEKNTVDMRAYIEHQGKAVSEVWNYVYQPQ